MYSDLLDDTEMCGHRERINQKQPDSVQVSVDDAAADTPQRLHVRSSA